MTKISTTYGGEDDDYDETTKKLLATSLAANLQFGDDDNGCNC